MRGLPAGRGGATMTGPAPRGRGTIRRGAGAPEGVVAAGVGVGAGAGVGAGGGGAATTATGGAGAATTATGGGVAGRATATTGAAETGAATATAGRCGGGAAFAAASACLRSRIAFSASPGLETFARLKAGLVSAIGFVAAERAPRLKYARTFSASSSSMELECVFFSVTPTAIRASRIGLLFTSSSRARSLIRTLLIRPFSVPLRA
jgi:hypothetical protein